MVSVFTQFVPRETREHAEQTWALNKLELG